MTARADLLPLTDLENSCLIALTVPFKRFQIEEVPVIYTICTASGGAARTRELIVLGPE